MNEKERNCVHVNEISSVFFNKNSGKHALGRKTLALGRKNVHSGEKKRSFERKIHALGRKKRAVGRIFQTLLFKTCT